MNETEFENTEDFARKKAALVFLYYGRYSTSSALYSFLLERNPSIADAWYELGNAVYGYGRMTRNMELLSICIACHRKAVELEPDHELSRSLLETMHERTPLSKEEVAAICAFDGSLPSLRNSVGYRPGKIAEDLRGLKEPKERMLLMMVLSSDYYPFHNEVLLAGLKDPDADVKMSALKRIDPSTTDSRFRERLAELVFSDDGDRCQPYLTFTLLNIAKKNSHGDWAIELLKAAKVEL